MFVLQMSVSYLRGHTEFLSLPLKMKKKVHEIRAFGQISLLALVV